MAALGELVVKLSANIAEFTGAMDKASYTAAQRMVAMEKAAKQAGVIIGGALVTGAGALGVAIGRVVEKADEMGKLADIAGASIESFSALTYATERHGIAADKLADIYKDVQDKVGDFVQNGGGPMKDFFDNVAPKVGVTADQFRRLSGPDALQLYYNSLEKANLSQSDMVFYMEAVANDATALIPLLKDNGAGFASAAAEAEKFGLVLSQDVREQSKAVKDNMQRVQAVVEGTTTKIAAGLLPTIESLSTRFVAAATDSDNLRMAGDGLAVVLKLLASGASIVATTFDVAGKGIATIAAAISAAARGEFSQAWEIIKMGGSDMVGSIEGSLKTLDGIWTEAETKARTRSQPDAPPLSSPLRTAAEDAKKRAKEIDAAAKAAEKAQQAIMAEGQRVFEQTRTPAEQLAAEYDRLNRLLEKGAIDWDTYGRAVMDAQDKLMPLSTEGKKAEAQINQIAETTSNVDMVITNAFQGMADAVADFALGGKASFGDMVNAMIRDLIRLEIQTTMTSAFKSIGGLSGIGNMFGTLLGVTYGTDAFSQQSRMLAAQDIGLAGARANGGMVSPGAAYLVGEHGPEILKMGNQAGTIFSNAQSSTPTINISIKNEAANTHAEVASTRTNGDGGIDVEMIVRQVMARDQSINGPITRGFGSRFGLRGAV